jgi:hypothetical protein
MKIRVIAVAVLMSVFAGSAGAAREQFAQFGAIAYSSRTHRSGYSTNMDSRAEAEREALSECRVRDCRIMVWFRNSCGILVTGNNGDVTAWAYDVNPKKARMRALKSCRERADGCKTVIEACSTEE